MASRHSSPARDPDDRRSAARHVRSRGSLPSERARRRSVPRRASRRRRRRPPGRRPPRGRATGHWSTSVPDREPRRSAGPGGANSWREPARTGRALIADRGRAHAVGADRIAAARAAQHRLGAGVALARHRAGGRWGDRGGGFHRVHSTEPPALRAVRGRAGRRGPSPRPGAAPRPAARRGRPRRSHGPACTVSVGSTTTVRSARSRWPLQRARASSTCSTPPTAPATASIKASVLSSVPSSARCSTALAARHIVKTIATVIASPTIASARSKPISTPIVAATTPSEVRPSVRACIPSATSAADPMRLPTRIRYCATASLPRNPSAPAAEHPPGRLDRLRMQKPADRFRRRKQRRDTDRAPRSSVPRRPRRGDSRTGTGASAVDGRVGRRSATGSR